MRLRLRILFEELVGRGRDVASAHAEIGMRGENFSFLIGGRLARCAETLGHDVGWIVGATHRLKPKCCLSNIALEEKICRLNMTEFIGNPMLGLLCLGNGNSRIRPDINRIGALIPNLIGCSIEVLSIDLSFSEKSRRIIAINFECRLGISERGKQHFQIDALLTDGR